MAIDSIGNNRFSRCVDDHSVVAMTTDGTAAAPRHVYAVEPAQVFAFGKEEGFSATRWRF